MKKKYGRFFVLSAPSGAGKTTLLNRLLADFPELGISVSCTTRTPRPGEKDGVDYRFIDEQRFREMVEAGDFFEWEEVHGAFYGTPKAPIMERRAAGLDTVFDLDTRGALNFKLAYPESFIIFVAPPSLEELEKRLRRRHTEAEESLKRRLENARREISEKDRFDCVIINDDLERAYAELKSVIQKKRS
jgi:guanylate kinase